MVRRAVKYAVIDAFTGTSFKGNPGAVCFLDQARCVIESEDLSSSWMQSVAQEFNISVTAFLIPSDPEQGSSLPRFHLRWFTPVAEVDLCGHGTLVAAHFLFTLGYVSGAVVEFVTRSGVLTAKMVDGKENSGVGGRQEVSFIELDFPVLDVVEIDASELPSIPLTLGGASVVGVKKIASGDLLVELTSGKDVADLKPQFDELRKICGRGLLITGPAPEESGFDFYTRFFCPKLGINEDPVCGSAHCALAPYWREKLGKCDLLAYMASPRSGRLDLYLDEKTQRVRIRGEAVTVMVGDLLA